MSNFAGFGDLVGNMGMSLFHSAVNATAAAATRALDVFAVNEITGTGNISDASQYPVSLRATPLLLHEVTEPATPGRFFNKPPAPFQIILHSMTSNRMFSMLRTDDRGLAEETFVLYKESFPLLAECDPSIYDASKLDTYARKLRENRGWTAPHLAAAMNLIGALKHDKMTNKLNDQEDGLLRTPLHIAVDCGNVAAVSTLLDLGVAADLFDQKGNSVFHLAASKPPQIFQMLVTKVPTRHQQLINHLNNEGLTPLHIACTNNNAEFVKTLLNDGADENICSPTHGYPMHCAIQSQSISCIQELAEKNPKQLQCRDIQDGKSPLHWANGPETVVILLDLGCDPNAADINGYTPLHNAVRRGCLRSTMYLLCHKAFPDLKGGDDNEAPIHIAARLCSKLVMQALIVFGADINGTDAKGDSPRHIVSKSLYDNKEKDELLFILSAVGAYRCPANKTESCVDGCKYGGNFNGTPPTNFPDLCTMNLMHEAMAAFTAQNLGTSNLVEGGTGTSSSSTNMEENHNENDFSVGGRLLSLDGGGIRGIVLTQMLMVIEQEMGMPIMELFDWVAGTSTGGILALALACGKSPQETQCIYMRLKDKVFVGMRPYSGAVMEEFLKKEFGTDTRMGEIRRPKVMIMTALVDRRPVDLHMFRNYVSPFTIVGEEEACPQEHSQQFVWQAAKVTGAAPSYFQLDHHQFIDGGLISNNPTLDALTELQQYSTIMKSMGYMRSGEKIPTTVVSLGTGRPPKTQSQAGLLDITWPTGVLDAITKVPRLASLVTLLIDQATQSEGQVVERSRAWCSSIGVPFYRFSPQMSVDIALDEKDDEKLVSLLWETRCYMVANKDAILAMKQRLMSS